MPRFCRGRWLLSARASRRADAVREAAQSRASHAHVPRRRRRGARDSRVRSRDFGAAFGAHPSVKPLHYGPIPFFRIDHNPVSRRKEFVITSAGFWMQHLDSEWILTSRPDLRHESSPLLKGIFGFDLATSAVYSTAAFGRFGPPERDTLGMSTSMGHDGIPEPIIGALILAPRCSTAGAISHPEATWAKWMARE